MAWSGLVSALGFAILGLLQVAGGTVILLGIATAGGTWTAFPRHADKT